MLDTNITCITISTDYAEQVSELLELCNEFLRQTTPAVRAELARYLAPLPAAPDSHLLIDLLGFTALFLKAKLAVATETDNQPPQHE
jgi:hypothetical protein